MSDDDTGRASANTAARTAVIVVAVFVLIALVLAVAGGFIDLRGQGLQMPSPGAPITVP